MIEAGSVTDRGFKRNASRRCEHRPGHRSAACTTRCLNPSTQENTSMTLNINAPEALVQQDFSAILKTIANAVQPLVGQGKVADYIPILAQVPAARFGMALATVDGRVVEVGDAGQPFSIQRPEE